MSRNLDRALEAIDEVLGHEGQSSPEEGYGVDRPGSCWRCLARDAETDTELCALCADYLKGETDEDPTAPGPRRGHRFLPDEIRDAVIYPSSYAVVDERHEFPQGIRVTDVVARWGTPPSDRPRHVGPFPLEVSRALPRDSVAFVPSISPPFTGERGRPSPIQRAAECEQAIAVIARAFEVDPEALERMAEAMRRIGVAWQEAMDSIRTVFTAAAEELRETFERFAEEHQDAEDERRERDRDRSRRALALYRRDPRRTLGPDLRATEAPRRAPHPNPRRRS